MDSEYSPRLALRIPDVVRCLQERQTRDVKDVLHELTAGVVRFLPSAQHAGVSVAAHGKVFTEACTGPFPALLDEIQGKYGEGPCLSAAKNDDVVRVDDIENEPRWPNYSRAVVKQTPIRSVLSVALMSDAPGVSALNLYAEKPNAFDVGSTESAIIYAAYTAMAWTLARRDDQFHKALQSRDIIGQAKGMIMERYSIAAEQAFELLKRLSQSSNTPLAEVAREVVEAERLESSEAGRQR